MEASKTVHFMVKNKSTTVFNGLYSLISMIEMTSKCLKLRSETVITRDLHYDIIRTEGRHTFLLDHLDIDHVRIINGVITKETIRLWVVV